MISRIQLVIIILAVIITLVVISTFRSKRTEQLPPGPEPEPEPECVTDGDCISPLICTDGVCASECVVDGDCDVDMICTDGVCVAEPECVVDGDCISPLICTDGVCAPECTVDGDCLNDDICENQVCYPPECTIEPECEDPLTCLTNRCLPNLICNTGIFSVTGTTAGATTQSSFRRGFDNKLYFLHDNWPGTGWATNRWIKRLNNDGTTDNTFVEISIPLVAGVNSVKSFLPLSDGSFVLLSEYTTRKVWKVTSSGVIDTSFPTYNVVSYTGGTPRVEMPFVVTTNGGFFFSHTDGLGVPNTMHIIKFGPTGIDTSYGVSLNGRVSFDPSIIGAHPSPNLSVYKLILNSVGEIYVLWLSTDTTQNISTILPTVTKITPAGVIDTTFGTNGTFRMNLVRYSIYGFSRMAINYDGSIYLGVVAITTPDTLNTSCSIVKLTPNGVPDTTWGTNGYFHTPSQPRFTEDSRLNNIMTETCGNIIITLESAGGYRMYRFDNSGVIMPGYPQIQMTGAAVPTLIGNNDNTNVVVMGRGTVTDPYYQHLNLGSMIDTHSFV